MFQNQFLNQFSPGGDASFRNKGRNRCTLVNIQSLDIPQFLSLPAHELREYFKTWKTYLLSLYVLYIEKFIYIF
jgi:hypothetical protein